MHEQSKNQIFLKQDRPKCHQELCKVTHTCKIQIAYKMQNKVPKIQAQAKVLPSLLSFLPLSCRCEEALEVNKRMITEEQQDYQRELQRKFRDFRDKLEPMVSTKKKHKRTR